VQSVSLGFSCIDSEGPMNFADPHTRSHRSKLGTLDGQPSVSRSLLRLSVLARVGIVTVIAAALWLTILWALA
jgi:hypothetical protein